MSVEGSVSRNVKNDSQHDAIPAGANLADDRASAWGAPGPNRRDRQPAKRGLGVGWSLSPEAPCQRINIHLPDVGAYDPGADLGRLRSPGQEPGLT
jgi:hypothetical protein